MPDREKVTKGLECCSVLEGKCEECPYDTEGYVGECVYALARDALELLKEHPEIVRCKDCEHGKPCNDGEYYCEKDIGTIKSPVHCPDWFCADGDPGK